MRIRKGSIRARVKGDVPISFTQERLSAHGGLELIRHFLDHSGFVERLRRLYSIRQFDSDYGSLHMTLALIAMLIAGVFEFYPKLRVGYLEAQNSWVPGILTRIEWDYPQYQKTHAPYLSLTPKEYFQRNCWAAVEGSEPEIEATAGLIGADRMCISTDYPHFDSNFPNVANNLLANVKRETAAEILMGGAHLWNFDEEAFALAAHAREQRELPLAGED